ncbi:FtsW/RodA/SpoVE family cell cycle protein [Paenibacillus apiarius]|uniref:FtsW/RodA/SpoVE family cell cycle protein n=1 Tax=Paenibacillus apiarius TaxID=46240 RepID=A0ABT4E115_9BACL|nr:FtsW/RodA/SpoVE family cell cycle protein [Paenibacillus apiarius]MCY9517790.1 FtsW/RodA/SpoVE family cell cycle protein [Paenibacillus apiarius]MCY9523302.1 FtsW/RodA/SpoVE family cell cycle protein [Paenibacillus apiarius]MCY9553083.1 FtsW/RodA/SpoVE family cell cycle protein [Paenibacillus apiarius]MCY9561599.1 FtsW/RodA/SpoVE family cell cycle protein [Paenibacillus apiarius]MCY9687126.1 FtsW/RodA/SpoVE family cell cycle protein [Paenibacillus apiarius]
MIFFGKLKKLDKLTLFIMACLIAIGTVAIHGATSGTNLDGLHINNMVLFVVFCIPMLLVAVLDYTILFGKMSYILYGIGIALLVLVMFTGENINGAVRWLSIGSFQLQPSEMMKLATVVLAAHLLHKRAGEQLRLVRDILPICIVFLIPIIIIMKQPDLGTALVFVGVMLSMLWMGNIRAVYMVLCFSVIALAVGIICWMYFADHDLLSKLVKPHQLSRIQTFLDPTSDPDKSWHVKNAMSAIGSGGLSGDNGFFLRRGFIPYAYSDSIYVVIGEKYGFLGSSVLLLLYFLLVYRLVLIVKDSRELAGSYLVLGLLGMLVFQIFVNIGMHIGLVPLTGISLPFISYGGSSLLTNMISIGLVLSVHIHKDEIVLEI